MPALSWREVVKAFERLGWALIRQHGSHRHYTHPDSPNILSIPEHSIIKSGTLSGLLRTAGVTREEFERARLGRRRPLG